MRNVFGKIANSTVVLNVIGRTALDCWREIPDHFTHVEIEAFVIMPNHVHGILTIPRSQGTPTARSIEDGHGCPVPLQRSPERFQRPTVGAIPTIIRSYKQTVTYLARQRLNRPSLAIWQSNYYERVLRDGTEFALASRYIFENPMKWQAATHP
jgi:putative transposase